MKRTPVGLFQMGVRSALHILDSLINGMIWFLARLAAPVAQWIEHWPPEPGATGSNPVRRAKRERRSRLRLRLREKERRFLSLPLTPTLWNLVGPLAQLVEQLTLNQRAVGSTPTRPTKNQQLRNLLPRITNRCRRRVDTEGKNFPPRPVAPPLIFNLSRFRRYLAKPLRFRRLCHNFFKVKKGSDDSDGVEHRLLGKIWWATSDSVQLPGNPRTHCFGSGIAGWFPAEHVAVLTGIRNLGFSEEKSAELILKSSLLHAET